MPMPSRNVVLAILAFWAATTAWMVFREILPRLRPGDPPPFTIDLTDEVSLAEESGTDNRASPFGARANAWTVELQGKKIGHALTRVLRHSDRTYEMQSDLWPTELVVPNIKINRLSSSYRITKTGELAAMSVRAVVSDENGLFFGKAGAQQEWGVEGEVKEGLLTLQAMRYEKDLSKRGRQDAYIKKDAGFGLQPTPVPPRGAVLNTLQPVNRLIGLHSGQTWRIPQLDPLETIFYALKRGDPPHTRYLDAAVNADEMTWKHSLVPCWRIDYAEPGSAGKVIARTWVQQSDGLVLQQDAEYAKMVLVVRRDERK
jgi:hypothetical protein